MLVTGKFCPVLSVQLVDERANSSHRSWTKPLRAAEKGNSPRSASVSIRIAPCGGRMSVAGTGAGASPAAAPPPAGRSAVRSRPAKAVGQPPRRGSGRDREIGHDRLGQHQLFISPDRAHDRQPQHERDRGQPDRQAEQLILLHGATSPRKIQPGGLGAAAQHRKLSNVIGNDRADCEAFSG